MSRLYTELAPQLQDGTVYLGDETQRRIQQEYMREAQRQPIYQSGNYVGGTQDSGVGKDYNTRGIGNTLGKTDFKHPTVQSNLTGFYQPGFDTLRKHDLKRHDTRDKPSDVMEQNLTGVSDKRTLGVSNDLLYETKRSGVGSEQARLNKGARQGYTSFTSRLNLAR
jgi:hypothetical protein